MENIFEQHDPRPLIDFIEYDKSLPVYERVALITIIRHQRCDFFGKCGWGSSNKVPCRTLIIEDADPTFDYLVYDFIEKGVFNTARHGNTRIALDLNRGKAQKGKTRCVSDQHIDFFFGNDEIQARLDRILEDFVEKSGLPFDPDETGFCGGYPFFHWLRGFSDEDFSEFHVKSAFEALRAGVPLDDIIV